MQLKLNKQKSRKVHQCDWCYQPIPKDTVYENSSNVNDGRVFTWKNHIYCGEITHKLKMFDCCDGDGLSADSFQEYIKNEYQNLMGDKLDDKNFVYPKFADQLQFVLKFYNIV